MGNPRVEFVRQCSKDNNISYGCAISEAGVAYRSMKKVGNPKEKKVKQSFRQKKQKKRKNLRKLNHLKELEENILKDRMKQRKKIERCIKITEELSVIK